MSLLKHASIFLVTIITVANGDGSMEKNGLPFSSSPSTCDQATETIRQLVQERRLSAVRSLAQNLPPACEKQASKVYVDEADKLLETLSNEEDGFSELLTSSLKSDRAQATMDDAFICSIVDTDTLMASDYWERCCSSLYEYSSFKSQEQPECLPDGIPVCCEFFQESPSHLRLPVLREVAIRIRLMLDNWELRFITLEQDGFLRPFDVSTVQWPSGYFMSLCVAAPNKCGIPELESILAKQTEYPIAIELGSGIGAASIALAMGALSSDDSSSIPKPVVIATDNSPQALALATSNVAGNSQSDFVKIQKLDHFDMDQVKELKESYFGSEEEGFSLVLGSSLLNFFVDTHQPNAPLWQALDILLDPSSLAWALLVHTKVEPVHPPSDSSFRLVRRISGDVFDMQTRSSESSDFELSVFERCNADCRLSESLNNGASEGEL